MARTMGLDMARTKTLLALAAAFSLAGCTLQASETDTELRQAATVALEKVEIDPKEAGHEWNYPDFPTQYQIDPLDTSRGGYMSGRALAEGGSYAGPWLEGEEARLLPVREPNVKLGDLLVEKLGNIITPDLKPVLSETPLQAFLKLRKGLEKVRLDDAPIDKERFWNLTLALYRKADVDYNQTIPVAFDPKSQSDKSLQKDGKGIFGNCNMCHGADGWGQGHSGLMLQPRPANFHEPRRLYNRSAMQLRKAIREGIYGSAMPQWQDKLSENEISHVVAFVRSFSYSTEDPTPEARKALEDAVVKLEEAK